jgi:hypothetical protein
MQILLVVVGILLLTFTDRLQPDPYRKPMLNIYLGYLGGLLWLVGIVLTFFDYGLLYSILVLFGSFLLGALLGIKPSK